MAGLLLKIVREAWLSTLLFALALAAVETLLIAVLPQFQEEFGQFLQQLEFVQRLITALTGVDVSDGLSMSMIQSFVWVHPVVLALLWAHEVVHCTRMPVAEIDRGTIDVLLGLPLSRRQVYLAETAVWLISGMLLLAATLAGHLVGRLSMDPEHRVGVGRLFMVLVNLYGVYVAVGGAAYVVSSLSDRRGRAIGTIFAMLLASFLLNFLAQLWDPARSIAFFSVLDHYRPAEIIRDGTWPWRGLAVLYVFGAAAWLLGGVAMCRRSMCTV